MTKTKTQAYAVLYNRNGLFLIAQKVNLAYYFGSSKSVVRKGTKLFGAGKFALPGGEQNSNENIEEAGVREFREETGVGLPPYSVITHTLSDGKYQWNVAYFCVDHDEDVQNKCSEIEPNSMNNAKTIVKAIQNNQIIKYQDLEKYIENNNLTPCPFDNELELVECWNLKDDYTWGKISTWSENPDMNWHYKTLQYLRTNILKIT
ncbi:NUDIX hydrolase [Burkholderia gladioli]|uniref:NUDIX hydrolase n=1 Tax=Burkholderia gladioli TaxID=28095 RepID=UPI000F542174|nr:NUDIX domain-containing protein [Burkholderia gladioli]MBU9276776.1 NUDIX domain-containing protein [Burkholderia gladioli]MDN7466313.1 NUDIX domain-containing protein [Burkholderia gladioli]MDN7812818.1 NUDIX domain-containing protein [Burkholderia gladioli]